MRQQARARYRRAIGSGLSQRGDRGSNPASSRAESATNHRQGQYHRRSSTAATGKDTVGHNKTVDLTSLINGQISGNTETLTTVSSASGSAVLSNGTVSYTAPASGPDTLTHTVQDQYADQATGTVNITVDPGPTAATGSADKLFVLKAE